MNRRIPFVIIILGFIFGPTHQIQASWYDELGTEFAATFSAALKEFRKSLPALIAFADKKLKRVAQTGALITIGTFGAITALNVLKNALEAKKDSEQHTTNNTRIAISLGMLATSIVTILGSNYCVNYVHGPLATPNK